MASGSCGGRSLRAERHLGSLSTASARIQAWPPISRRLVGVERAAITRQTLRGGLLRMFARVTLTAPGVPVVR
jgi:hypothetical protein